MKMMNKFYVVLLGALCSLGFINAADQAQAEKKTEVAKQYSQAEKDAAVKKAIKRLERDRHGFIDLNWYAQQIEKYDLDPNLIRHRIYGSLLFKLLEYSSGPKWFCPKFKFAKQLIVKGADANKALQDLMDAHSSYQLPLALYTVRLLLDAKADASKIALDNIEHLDPTQLLLASKAQVTESDAWKTTHKNPNVLLAYYLVNPLITKATINNGSRILRCAMDRKFDGKKLGYGTWGRFGVDRLELIPYAQNFVKLGYSIKRKDFNFGYSQACSTILGWRRPQNIMEELQEYIDQAETMPPFKLEEFNQNKIELQNNLMILQVILAKATKDSEQQGKSVRNLLKSYVVSENVADLIADYGDACLTADVIKQLDKVNQHKQAIAADQEFTENLGTTDINYSRTETENARLETRRKAEKADRREHLPDELFKVIPVSPIDKGPIGLIMGYDNPEDDLLVEMYEAKIQAEKDAILAQIEAEKTDRREQLPQELLKVIPAAGPTDIIMSCDDPQDRVIPACVAPYLEHTDYTPRT